MPTTFTVLLWPVTGHEAELHSYEDDVLRLVDEHRGRVLVRLRSVEADADHPLETQIIEFADEAAFDSYMQDSRRQAMARRRDRCVARTQMWRVESA
ncbi:DUF1330 domain-containing protein [Gordonia sp. SID5947]|uniref:DUF1330 domain-containing protein n=1 Tax=Gordonia sp. SID5947 TaxID=2690315 RepID=UPI00136DD2C3|nr:DUF1330 domain-containing protein [Gordonia sp. SID5947]MYR08123.1 DUF1330 domain-containing protein [Gordonia sp. SID5947]